VLRFLVGDANGPSLVQWTRYGPRGQVATVTAEFANGRTREIQRVEHTPDAACPRCGEPTTERLLLHSTDGGPTQVAYVHAGERPDCSEASEA
jgi:hypothetical protein